jgi:hypothetical protein
MARRWGVGCALSIFACLLLLGSAATTLTCCLFRENELALNARRQALALVWPSPQYKYAFQSNTELVPVFLSTVTLVLFGIPAESVRMCRLANQDGERTCMEPGELPGSKSSG